MGPSCDRHQCADRRHEHRECRYRRACCDGLDGLENRSKEIRARPRRRRDLGRHLGRHPSHREGESGEAVGQHCGHL